MAYIPEQHKQYDLLPFRREHGGEVFEDPSKLLSQINTLLDPDDHLDPYGYSSYEEYDQKIDRVAQKFCDQPEKYAMFDRYKQKVHEMNCKEQWSVLRYIGPDDGRLFSLTRGRCYYWPCSVTNPVYSGVVDDEEYTSYFHPTDSHLWEILEDPTGMAHNTIYRNGKNRFSKVMLDHIMKQLENAVIEDSE